MKMKAVTSSEMKAKDLRAIEKYGIPGLILMENAGRGIAELIYNLLHRQGRVTLFVGRGNNGGDGLVIARHLHNRGIQVLVLLFAEPARLKPDAAVNYEIVKKMKIPLMQISDEEIKNQDLDSYVLKSDLIVDAVFGIGLKKRPEGIYARAIEAMNQHGGTVVAVDIASGLESDSGEVLGTAVKATHTATLGCPKQGLFRKKGPEHSGKICVVDISLPRELVNT